MKISHVTIENFRHIERLSLDFTDSVGRVRDVSMLVGPNTSGKTTILDALSLGVGIVTELFRPQFTLKPRNIVRRGALSTRVVSQVRFSEEEIAATRRLYKLAELPVSDVLDTGEVQITWEYPSKDYSLGRITCEPYNGWHLFKGRVQVARLLSTGRVDWNWFERVGGLFIFNQQRTGMGKTIPREIWNIINGESEGDYDERHTSDPRTILLSLAVKSMLPPLDEDSLDEFKQIQQKYAEICAPRRIKGAVRNELGEPELLFTDGTYEYRYNGTSSGEQMLLLFLIRMVTEHIHQSIVLVDEIELHQHPLWQRRLLYLLPRMGTNNQIIATTHSSYLRDVLSPQSIISLGQLGDQASGPEA